MRGHVSCTIEQYKVHDELGGVEKEEIIPVEETFPSIIIDYFMD